MFIKFFLYFFKAFLFMSKILNILLFIIFFLLFFFLIFLTFFVSQYNYIEEISYLNFNSGIFGLSLWDDSKVIEKKLDNSFSQSWSSIFVHKISYLDDLYFDTKESYEMSSSSIYLNKPGIFLIDINDLSKDYKISHKWFLIEPLSIWKIFIDTNNSEKQLIFSIDSTFKLSFKNFQTGDILTESYFFPHQLIKFNPLRNLNLRKADFLRVTSVLSPLYIKDRLFDWSRPSDILSSHTSEDWFSFLNIALADIISKQRSNMDNYYKLNSISIWSFPGKDTIKKYASFFYNDSKKAVYYKNNILSIVQKLFKSKIYEKIIIDDLIFYLNNLKELDKDEYYKMLKIIDYYDKVIALSDNFESIETKLNFLYLKQFLNWESISMYKNRPFIFLKLIYSLFDNWEKTSPINDFTLFTDSFLENLWVNISQENIIQENVSRDKIIASDSDNILIIDYFLGFFKALLLSDLYLKIDSNSQNLKSNLNLINKYIFLNYFIYLHDSTLWRKQTGLHESLELYNKLSLFMRLNFFEENRNNQWLLVLKINSSDYLSPLKSLEKNMKNVIKNYIDNKNLISNNKSNINDYEKIISDFPEYFLALFSYSKYSLDYDITKKNLRNVETINKWWDNPLTKDDFIDYMSRFNSLVLDNVSVEIEEDYYFKVNNLVINWLNFSFNLYPYDWNTITDIVISWEWIISDKERLKIWKSSYKLDFMKESLDKKLREYSWEDKNKYDFRNFFVNTFFYTNKFYTNEDDFIKINDSNSELEEDKFVITFKRDKLLGEKDWEFSEIKDFLKIKYNDIKVTRIEDEYEIYLDKVFFDINIPDSWRNKFTWEFSSNYILKDEYHDFKNVKLRLYDKYTKDDWIKFLIWGNYINLNWTIYIINLENELLSLLYNFDNIFMVYNKLNSILSIDNMDINHDISTNRTEFTAIYNNKNLIILLSWNRINSIIFSWKNIGSDLDLNKLGIVLNWINNKNYERE